MTEPRDLMDRTFNFARGVLQFCSQLPQGNETGIIKRQLVRAATSVGANYRAARRAKSRRDFLFKLSTVEEGRRVYLLAEAARDKEYSDA